MLTVLALICFRGALLILVTPSLIGRTILPAPLWRSSGDNQRAIADYPESNAVDMACTEH